MEGNITWEALWAVAGIVGAAFVIWWRIEMRVERAKKDAHFKVDAVAARADLTAAQLAEYKTHVAEQYATKAGVTEQMITLTKAVNDVGERLDKRLDAMTERLDRVIEANHKSERSHPP